MRPVRFLGDSLELLRDFPEDARRRAEAVYVLHAVHKKTQRTSKRDLETARRRFAMLSTRGER